MAARRRTSTRRSTRSNNAQSQYREGKRKSYDEARVERMTWALLVGVFAVLYLLPEGTAVPNWVAPLAGAVILFGSGLYQYSRGWRVAPVIWIGGSLMLVSVYYGSQMDPTRDLIGFTLLVFAGVIGFGLITGEG